MKASTPFLILITLMSFSSPTSAKDQGDSPAPEILPESAQAFEARMEWWRDATFGMFIHWGLYAVPAGYYQEEPVEGIGEWIMDKARIPVCEYEQFATRFNPVQFDAEEWVRIAKDAGMKYIVITSKHHDGFCLWDSDLTEYDVVDATPYGRDLLAQLRDACEEAGIRLCFYHSIMDWHHPDAQAPHYPDYNSGKVNPRFPEYFEHYLKPQVQELITRYRPHVMWYDGEWIPEYTHGMGVELYNFNRRLNPDLIINNRVDKGRRGMEGMNDGERQYAGDFGTPEQRILEGTSSFDWESCMTMNDTWGYKRDDHNWKSARTLIHNLADIAAKGGNYLLNVGPTAEGLIPQPSVERLAEMGEWLQVNGEAIYGTDGGEPYHEGDSIRYTRSADGNTVYAIALEWPGTTLVLEQARPRDGDSVYLLGHDKPLTWEADQGKAVIHLPAELQDPAARPCQYAWTFRIGG